MLNKCILFESNEIKTISLSIKYSIKIFQKYDRLWKILQTKHKEYQRIIILGVNRYNQLVHLLDIYGSKLTIYRKLAKRVFSI